MLQAIRQRVSSGGRIDRAEAAWLWAHADDPTLRELAMTVRARFHRPDRATWLVMAIINYTNVCVAKCDYCAFYRLPKQEGGYLLTFEQVSERIEAVIGLGATLVGFNGGFHPEVRLDDYADLFSRIRQRFDGRMEFYALTVAEFMYACKVSRRSYADGARQLADAGVRWITGGGAEVLDDAFRRRHSPLKYKVGDYYDATRAVLDAGLGSTATMVIGFDETLDERLNHLEGLRAFQDEAGGALPSFLCWTYKPSHTALGGDEITEREYLRWLALSRIWLDNIPHIRTSVLTRNEGGLRGLAYGADDFDLPCLDEVTEMAGATISLDFDALLDVARREGFHPEHRGPWPPPPPPARPPGDRLR